MMNDDAQRRDRLKPELFQEMAETHCYVCEVSVGN